MCCPLGIPGRMCQWKNWVLVFFLFPIALSPELCTQTPLNSKPICPTAYLTSPPSYLIVETQHVQKTPHRCLQPPLPGDLLFPVSVNKVLPVAQVKNPGVVYDSPFSHPHTESIRKSSPIACSTLLEPYRLPYRSSNIPVTLALWPSALAGPSAWFLCPLGILFA